MIASVFTTLEKEIDAYIAQQKSLLQLQSSQSLVDEIPEDYVSLLEGEVSDDMVRFQMDRISALLLNVEEEQTLRAADRYSRVNQEGIREPQFPSIRLNLYILFVFTYQNYKTCMTMLDWVIRFFQQRPIMEGTAYPDLDKGIDKLLVELITLPFAEQNEVWNALRSAYRPSLLYRFKMLVFEAQPLQGPAGPVDSIQLQVPPSPTDT